METVIFSAEIEDKSHLDALKAMMVALKIKFQFKESYNPEFVEKIKLSEKEIEEGLFTDVNPNEINDFIKNL
jgi:hypothetical protein